MGLSNWPTVTDDDGSYTLGTVFNKSLTDAILASIEADLFSAANPSVTCENIIDEVVTARGSKASLDARLDVSINDDGTLKAIAGQASETQLASQMGQANWVKNDTFVVWDGGDSAAPAGWTLDTLTIARETTTVKIGTMGVKLTRAGTDGSLYQNVMSTGAFTNFGTYYKGRKMGFGCWVNTSVASAVRIKFADGATTTTTSYHTGGGTWEFLSQVHTVSNSATYLRIHLEVLNSNGDAYFGGPTVIESTLEPSGWFPCRTALSTLGFVIVGSASASTNQFRYVFERPALLRNVQLYMKTAPTGAALIFDINNNGNSAFTTKPQVDATANGGSQDPDGTYQYRCFGGEESDAPSQLLTVDCDQVGSTIAGADGIILIRFLEWFAPFEDPAVA